MHKTPADNRADLKRKLHFKHLREPQQVQRNMKPKSLPLRLFEINSAAAETLNLRATKYERHVDCADPSDSQPVEDSSRCKEKCHREVPFAFLSEKYEVLIDDEAQAKAKEEKKKKKKEKYKKVKKNVGKAVRVTWKCLMLGLYNFALGYSTPITVAATFGPDFHPGRNTN